MRVIDCNAALARTLSATEKGEAEINELSRND